MTAQIIEAILNENLKPDSIGRIQGKSRANSRIMSEHLTSVDNKLTDIRIYIAKISTGHTTKEALEMIDKFIYEMQIKP